MDNTYILHSSSKEKEKRNIVLDGSTMEYEKKTITSFVKYHRRENGQYLHPAFIIEEKRKKEGKIVLDGSTMDRFMTNYVQNHFVL